MVRRITPVVNAGDGMAWTVAVKYWTGFDAGSSLRQRNPGRHTWSWIASRRSQ
jgi:hypothetical protein